MTAAVLWIGLGAAAILSIGVEFAIRPDRSPMEDGITGRVAVGGPLIVLGILILTGVLGRTVASGVASLVIGGVLSLLFLGTGIEDVYDRETETIRVERLAVPALGLVLLTAGGLAATGGRGYRHWWRARRPR